MSYVRDVPDVWWHMCHPPDIPTEREACSLTFFVPGKDTVTVVKTLCLADPLMWPG